MIVDLKDKKYKNLEVLDFNYCKYIINSLSTIKSP